MKPSSLQKIITVVLSLSLIGIFIIPGIAEAQGSANGLPGVGILQGVVPSTQLPSALVQATAPQVAEPGMIETGVRNAVMGAITFIIEWMLTFVSWLLTLAGLILDYVLGYTVFGMSTFLKDNPAVNTAWTTIRDFCNIAFIFVLLYIAISTILQRDASKKLIPAVLVAALLVNYSFFFTKVIIDVSNVVTVRFYNAIKISGTVENNTQDPNMPKEVTGLGAVYMTKMGLVNIHRDSTKISAGNVLVSMVMGTIFILIATFAFAAISVLFVIRFVMLLLLLIFSPVMFVSSILPATKKYNAMWWDKLNAECLFAPLFMILTWISLQLTSTITLQDPSTVNLAFNFIIVTAFMVASVVVSKQVGARGGAAMSSIGRSWGNNLRGAVGSYTLGRAGRGLGGAYDSRAAALANSGVGRFVNRIPLVGAGIGALDKGVRSQLRGVEESTYGGRKNLGQLERDDRARNLALNSALVDRDSAAALETKKKALASALALDPSDPTREGKIAAAVYGLSDKDVTALKYDLQNNPEVLRNLKSSQFDALVDDRNDKLNPVQRKALKDARKKHLEEALTDINSTDAGKKAAAQEAVKKLIQGRSGSEIAGYSNSSLTTLSENGLMSKSIADAIDRRTDLTTEQKAALKYASQNKIFNQYVGDPSQPHNPTPEQTASMERALADLSPKDFASMSSNYHTNARVMQKASVGQLNELMKSDNVSQSTKDGIMKARFADVLKLSDTAAVAGMSATEIQEIQKRVKSLSHEEIEHLAGHNNSLLSNHNFVSAITPKTMERISDSQRLLASQKSSIKTTRLKPLTDAIDDLSVPSRSIAAKATIKAQIRQLDTKTLASLDVNQLKNHEVLEHLNTQVLHQMRDDHAKASEIRTAIEGAHRSGVAGNIPQLHSWLQNKGRDFGV